MNEWQVITMLITLAGGVVLIVRPIINLTKAITELTVTCKKLDEQFSNFESSNKESHRRIWAHEEKQDETLEDHERRISRFEERSEKQHEEN